MCQTVEKIINLLHYCITSVSLQLELAGYNVNVFAAAAHDTGAVMEREDVTKKGHTPFRV